MFTNHASSLSHNACKMAVFVPIALALWAAPHTAFLAAPVERRHLICLAFAKAGGQALPVTTDLLLGATPDAQITGNRSYTRAHFLYYAGVVTPGTYR